MVIFEKKIKTKSDQNTRVYFDQIAQICPNCTVLKKFLWGACPRTPLAMRMASPCAACRFATCKVPNFEKKILGPPPSQILGTLL